MEDFNFKVKQNDYFIGKNETNLCSNCVYKNMNFLKFYYQLKIIGLIEC